MHEAMTLPIQLIGFLGSSAGMASIPFIAAAGFVALAAFIFATAR